MTIAFIINNSCVNIAVFDIQDIHNIDKAFKEGFDELVECPEGFGIGDNFIDGVWSKKKPTPTEPTFEERLLKQEQENKELKAKLEVTQAVVDEIALGGMM